MKSLFANTAVHTFVSASILSAMLWAGTPAQAAAPQARLSLDPHAALLSYGATFFDSGYDAPIRLPANGDTPAFSLGFTIPNDYEPNTALHVVVLWEGTSTGCDYVLQSALLYRARDGQPRDAGYASGGFLPISASTAFSIFFDNEIAMQAPATAHQTASARFDITPTPGEFPSLQSGDA